MKGNTTVEEIVQKYTTLKDNEFVQKHPGIIEIAAFLQDISTTHYERKGYYQPFDQLGIKTVNEYLNLVQQKNKSAIELYGQLKRILNLKK